MDLSNDVHDSKKKTIDEDQSLRIGRGYMEYREITLQN